MYTIHEEWQSFLTDVISPEASPQQVWIMRCAFYAGANSLDSIFQRMADQHEAGNLPKPGPEMLSVLRQEMIEFFEIAAVVDAPKGNPQ